jgi:hypothetical protein
MKIMVCLKQVPHQDARLDIDGDGDGDGTRIKGRRASQLEIVAALHHV